MTDDAENPNFKNSTDDSEGSSSNSEAVGDFNPNRMITRRSPVGESKSSLVSRDYQPRTGGPELMASWPLGPAPAQETPEDTDWEITSTSHQLIQKNRFSFPYAGPVDYNKIYLNVCGKAYIDAKDEVLSLELSCNNLTGKPHETTIELSNEAAELFLSPMIELAPDDRDAYGPHEFIGREMYSGYVFSGSVSGGTGYLDQGTSVQLWSE